MLEEARVAVRNRSSTLMARLKGDESFEDDQEAREERYSEATDTYIAQIETLLKTKTSGNHGRFMQFDYRQTRPVFRRTRRYQSL